MIDSPVIFNVSTRPSKVFAVNQIVASSVSTGGT